MLVNNKHLKNREFQYWLQGYFEIEPQSILTEQQLILIEEQLHNISENWDDFNSWINQALHFIKHNQYDSAFVAAYTVAIQKELNSLFEHVIDDSYETPHSKAYLKAIHDGVKV
jgi:hypothetical protein